MWITTPLQGVGVWYDGYMRKSCNQFAHVYNCPYHPYRKVRDIRRKKIHHIAIQKSIRVYNNGRYWYTIGGFRDKIKRKIRSVLFYRWYPSFKALFITGLFVIVFGMVLVQISVETIYAYTPQSIFEIKDKIIIVKDLSKELPPVMKRIMMCESSGNQNIKHPMKEDRGLFGINITIWGNFIKKLKKENPHANYDVETAEGNTNVAMAIYREHASEPWYLSKKCWNR